MDRSMFGQWKAEEKELSEKLYMKLKVLTLLYPPTEEFKKCLCHEMFLKPNPQAFFQVMHFLFRVYDANEFKKRFYWPLTDKRSEALFRSSAVEYLKQICEKHNLQWNVKSYLVVMPVGTKFINFLLDFIALIVKELTLQREKKLQADVNPVWNIELLMAENSFLKELASKFVSDTNALIDKYHEKILAIREEFAKMAARAGIDLTQFISEEFLESFEADNQALFQSKFCGKENKLKELIAPMEALCNVAQKVSLKETAVNKPNMEKVCKVLNNLSEEFMEIPSIKNEKEINMEVLITAFNFVQPQIVSLLEQTNSIDYDDDFESEQLKKLLAEFEDFEKEVLEFKESVQRFETKLYAAKQNDLPVTPLRELCALDIENRSSNIDSLLSKYVSTPPIKVDANNGGVVRSRIAFWDEQLSNEIENYEPSLSNRSTRKPFALADRTLTSLNASMNKSVIDAAQMLRSLHQSSKKQKSVKYEENMSMLTKWREHEVLFDSLKTDATLMHLDVSPGHDSKMSDPTMIANTKKLSAIKKVQKDSLHLQNVSTSPSGRLESLVPSEESIIKMLPKLTLNDSFSDKPKYQVVKCENKQNNSASVISVFSLKDNEDSGNEELFNTSDSVLKDIML